MNLKTPESPHLKLGFTRNIVKKCARITAGRVFDPFERTFQQDQVITVDTESGLILDQRSLEEPSFDPLTVLPMVDHIDFTDLDLRHLTVLPGFVDVHVHLFLHPYSETPWTDQLTRESLAERTIRATVHARDTLLAGFTTVRDLGTEGAFDADIALRKCLSRKPPLILGPRYYCATRAITTTGSYGPKSSLYPAEEGIDGVTGAETADGLDQCIRAVRRQIGAGADWIKIYAGRTKADSRDKRAKIRFLDYSVRSRLGDISSATSTKSISTFSRGELEAMISTAHSLQVKVAAHAHTADAINVLLELGVDTIEHGGQMYGNPKVLVKLREARNRTTWVPTLAAYYTGSLNGTLESKETWELCKKTFQQAVFEFGIDNIACGGDTGVFPHGHNALELILMRKLGVDGNKILSWATLGGWKCVRGPEWDSSEGTKLLSLRVDSDVGSGLERERPFGAIRRGWAADLVGLEGTLDGSEEEFEKALMQGVKFVMKGGVSYRQ